MLSETGTPEAELFAGDSIKDNYSPDEKMKASRVVILVRNTPH